MGSIKKALNLADKLWDKGRKDEARDILKDVIKELKSSKECCDQPKPDLSSPDGLLTSIPNVSFDDVIGLDEAKKAFTQSVLEAKLLPELFELGFKRDTSFLLYGCPGVGKTRFLQAAAKFLTDNIKNSKVYVVSAGNLLSKYHGEGERKISALFAAARNQPSLIIIDEFDQMCAARTDDESYAARSTKNQFLMEIQGFNSYSRDILLIGCTNRPYDIDVSMLSRFHRIIYVSPPDFTERCQILNKNLHMLWKSDINAKEVELIAEKTYNFTGRDIENLIRRVASEQIPNLQAYQTSGATEMSIAVVIVDDILEALKGIHSSVDDAEISKLEDFAYKMSLKWKTYIEPVRPMTLCDLLIDVFMFLFGP